MMAGKRASFQHTKDTGRELVCHTARRFDVLVMPVHKRSKTLTPAMPQTLQAEVTPVSENLA